MNPLKNNALIIFIKAPRLEEVKTRLQPELSPELALRLHKAMGADLADHFSRSQHFDFFIRYWPEDAVDEIREWLGSSPDYIAQQGSDLGEKLKNAFLNAFRANYQKVCIIGSDLPTLKEPDVLDAFKKLDASDVVLGPSLDGGYYLIGLKKLYPKIFEKIDWSTEYVLSQTRLKIARQNLSVHQMAVQRDIDTYEDVVYLWDQISEDKNDLRERIPKTTSALKDIFNESK